MPLHDGRPGRGLERVVVGEQNIGQPQPALWPWLVGLVALALLIWAIAELVNTDRDNRTMVNAGEAAAPAAAAAPEPVAGDPAAAQPDTALAPIGALLPLGTQDVGQRVRTTGVVLGQPGDGGFWLRTQGRALLWVRSNTRVLRGQQVQDLVGTIEHARQGVPGAALDAQVARDRELMDLTFVPGLYLDAAPAPTPAPRVARAGSGIAGRHSPTEARARRGTGRPGRAG